MSLAEAIHDALQIPAPHTSQERVQETVAGRLEGLTPQTSVRRTGYFNHSWAPDLVVKSRDQAERWVFLRFDVKDASFEDDLRYLAPERPFFLDLVDGANGEGPEGTEGFELAAALSEEGRDEVLVSDIEAIDQFDSSVQQDHEVQTATQQVVMGGRGLVGPSVAERIVGSWQQASGAVAEANAETLRGALNDVEAYLNRVAALDLETDLRAKWIAAGQPAETFPGQEDWRLADRAPWEIAQLVLALTDRPTAVDAARWGEIAQAISASDLGHELYRIGTYKHGGPVDDLARAGLPYWTAQYAYAPPLESDSIERFDWAFGSYSLEINLIRRRAFFTNIGRKWTRVPRASGLPQLRARLDALTDTGVLGVGIITPEENVSHELRPSATSSLGTRLEPFIAQEADAAWRAARLTWLELRVPGTGATAHVDFDRSVVRTSEPVPLRTYVLLVAEFVAGLDADELAELEGRLAQPPRVV